MMIAFNQRLQRTEKALIRVETRSSSVPRISFDLAENCITAKNIFSLKTKDVATMQNILKG